MLYSQVIDLGKSYGVEEIFRHVSLDIRQGDRIGIVGPNGAGKTTFFRIFCGLLEPDQGRIAHSNHLRIGYLEQFQNWPVDATVRDILEEAFEECRRVGIRKQNLEHQMSQAAPEEQTQLLEEYGRVQQRFEHLGGYEQEFRMQKVSQGLGFGPQTWDQKTAILSGGEKTRLALARLLLSEPDLLFLDEPTNHLDILMLQWLESFLLTFSGAILVISHDRSFLDRVTTSTLAFAEKTAKSYPGPYTHYLKILDLERESQLKAYEKQQLQIAKTEAFIDKYRAGIKSKQARGRQLILNRLKRLSPPEVEAELGEILFVPQVQSNDPVLSFEDLSIGYSSDSPLIQSATLEIRRGQGIALIGPNGTGKTTLVKTLVQQLEPLAGLVRFGKNTHIGYFSQHQETLDPHGMVLTELMNDPAMTENRARKLLGRFLFRGDDVFKPISTLSGGERARLALLKLLLSGANFLILDEPTNHLDIASQETIEQALENYTGTFLVISHDRYFIDQIADTLWMIEDEKIVAFSGNYSDYETFLKKPIPPPLQVEKGASSQSSAPKENNKLVNQSEKRKKAAQLRSLEKEIEKLEQEKEAFEQQFADPTLWETVEGQEASLAYEELQKKIAVYYEEWEVLSYELEQTTS